MAKVVAAQGSRLDEKKTFCSKNNLMKITLETNSTLRLIFFISFGSENRFLCAIYVSSLVGKLKIYWNE